MMKTCRAFGLTLIFLLGFLFLDFQDKVVFGAINNSATLSTDSFITYPNASITVYGKNFTRYEKGYVYIDLNNSNTYTKGEPYTQVSTSSSGSFTSLLFTGNIKAGTYWIRYLSSGGRTYGTSVKITIKYLPELKVYPDNEQVGAKISVLGDYFLPNQKGRLFFDSNQNKTWESEEPSVEVSTNQFGYFSSQLTVPNVKEGFYSIYFQPVNGSKSTSTYFKVVKYPSISVSVLNRKVFAGQSITVYIDSLPEFSEGYIYLDTNNNERLDGGESNIHIFTQKKPFNPIAFNIPKNLEKGKTYFIRFESSRGVMKINPATVEVIGPTVTLSTTSAAPKTTITLNGSYFPWYVSTNGFFYFDSNANGRWDSNEPTTGLLPIRDGGSFVVSLTIPNVKKGSYLIRYGIKSGVPYVDFTYDPIPFEVKE
ncbi:hypothetical protein [uncultured Anoxybacillus sp.]|uniref:hypothetical protein n=1 Tax=uncultured Anoxybacillus sp. TaxID=263860 RepID=UPI002626EDF4|nr:hypothetical protein [uncultured Anoxybacillus sp.]